MRKSLAPMVYVLCLSLVAGVLVLTAPSGAFTVESLDINPKTLNLESNGTWITVFIVLPEDYQVGDINVTTVRLGNVPAAWDKVEEDKLVVKFDRQTVIGYIWAYKLQHMGIPLPKEGVEVDLTVTGELYDGTPFDGSDTIRVIQRG